MISPSPSSQSVLRLSSPDKTFFSSAANPIHPIIHRHSHPCNVGRMVPETSDRRRCFRARCSTGVTIASAPSVEHEDYRSPKLTAAFKNGKSFDFVNDTATGASDSNALLQVSTDFLRLYGNRQQFRNLLTARRKLGTLPPAYTKIDDASHESAASGSGFVDATFPTPPATSELQLKLTLNKPSLCSSLFSRRSLDKELLVIPRNGGETKSRMKNTLNGNVNRGLYTLFVGGFYHHVVNLMNESKYIRQICLLLCGIQVDDTTASYRIRSYRLKRRVELNDRCVIFAVVGILFMIIDNEITGQPSLRYSKDDILSLTLRTMVACSTLLLLTQICLYHINELKLEMFDCGADDWRVVISFETTIQIIIEIVACAICPLPGTGYVQWTFMETTKIQKFITTKEVPLDVVLSLLMLIRVYLIARFMVLHSKQFQDASTRTLAALNRIQVNFSFVMKSILDQHPIAFLTTFTMIFWLTTAWTFAQCERYGRNEQTTVMYSNALWFIAITLMLNGYGDIVPHTQCGRTIAVTVGVVGATVSSILIAVISRKILLSEDQRNVNNFMNDSRLSKEYKEAAARVLQYTWHIYKCLSAPQYKCRHGDSNLRNYQRKFLRSIHNFRQLKNRIRIFSEKNFQSTRNINRILHDMHIAMQRVVATQEELKLQLDVLQRITTNNVAQNNN